MSKLQFERLVGQALAELPPQFARAMEEVPIEIRDKPTVGELGDLGLPADGLLLGLYRGRPRTRRSVEDSGAMPDVIYVFQSNIERICNSEAQLVNQVRTTVLHEIGHHFGMDETDLEQLGYG